MFRLIPSAIRKVFSEAGVALPVNGEEPSTLSIMRAQFNARQNAHDARDYAEQQESEARADQLRQWMEQSSGQASSGPVLADGTTVPLSGTNPASVVEPVDPDPPTGGLLEWLHELWNS